jgi:amino acid transporter
MAEASPPRTAPALERALGWVDAGALVVGCVIGAGIFRLSDSVAQKCASPFQFFLAWVLGGILSLCGALCYAELATRFPRTGGDYVFLTQAYGRFWGFLFGWTKIFVQRTGTLAILAVVFAEHAAQALGFPPLWIKPVATGAIAVLTVANIRGIRWGKGVQNTFTGAKLAALILIVGAGLLAGKGSWAGYSPFWPDHFAGDFWSTTGLALIFVLWTYGGWTEAAYVAEEVRDPSRNLPRAIVGGLLTVTVFYLAVNAVYLAHLPLPEMARTNLVAAGTMDKIWPGTGGRAVAAMVMASTFGALNGFILTGGRILQALGKDHTLFGKLGRISPRRHTPSLALLLNSVLAVFLVWTGTLDTLVTYTEIVIYLFFAASGASVFVFRRRENAPPEGVWRVWGYPFTPAVFTLMCLAFAGNAIAEQPRESLLGIGVGLLGAPLYFVSQRLKRRASPL